MTSASYTFFIAGCVFTRTLTTEFVRFYKKKKTTTIFRLTIVLILASDLYDIVINHIIRVQSNPPASGGGGRYDSRENSIRFYFFF